MPAGDPPVEERWNHNIQYHPLIHAAAPAPCHRALDVGCGDGLLARELLLRGTAAQVVGLDRDEPSIARARALTPDGVTWIVGDLLTHPFEPASFDLVAGVAFLHHLDTEAGLRRMAELLRPGGVIAVVGLGRARHPQDLPRDVLGAVYTRWLRWVGGRREWAHQAPVVWSPPLTFRETQRLAARVLPGSSWKRLVLWRYALTWTKPV